MMETKIQVRLLQSCHYSRSKAFSGRHRHFLESSKLQRRTVFSCSFMARLVDSVLCRFWNSARPLMVKFADFVQYS
ncbi:hypothetical protein GOP47_0013326 [Adiantum capillus-veneris]|uniref:Uncharacterized protein n=1 Tax=Adiantum capillus-veneris TaxID=13818 RepID=A0A9D4UNI9_ADICA|nr:hypothetical protein GOP47_0013326 [Adiantum capillus-veneris]